MPSALLDHVVIMPRKAERSVFPTSISEWVYKHRKMRGLTQVALAERAGISSAHISKVEAGIASLSREMIPTIAEAMMPEGYDSHTLAIVRDEGLVAAGFLPGTLDEDEQERRRMELVYQAYQGTAGPIRDAANAILGLRDDLTGEEMTMDDIAKITGQDGNDARTIGKRAK